MFFNCASFLPSSLLLVLKFFATDQEFHFKKQEKGIGRVKEENKEDDCHTNGRIKGNFG
jgi:hypothetical protein